MAHKAKSYAVSALRALTYRLASTPTAQLPRSVAQLAAAIWSCREILSTPADALKHDGDLSLVVHRFKTQLSTLLQDRSVEGRWSAIVLVKATIEAGGVEILSKSNAWVRSLLAILKRPDPPTSRTLAVLTLTRVFMLTWDHSNLVREITTPALPTFVSTCIGNVENARCSSEELQSILEAFETLISHHPTIFRSNESLLRSCLIRLVSSSAAIDSHRHYSSQHIQTAQRLLVLLSFCAPKQGGSESWAERFQATVRAAHQTCDAIFIPVVETWKSNNEAYRDHGSSGKQSTGRVARDDVDALGLGAWNGVNAGTERLTSLIEQIKAHFEAPSPATVLVRIGIVVDLVLRICAVSIPGANDKTSLQINPQVSKEDRNALFAALPAIHASVADLLSTMINRLDSIMTPVLPTVLEAVLGVFPTDFFDPVLRASHYSLLRTILLRIGVSLEKDEITDLSATITACCNDLLPEVKSKTSEAPSINGKQHQAGDLVLQMNKTEPSNPTQLQDVHTTAAALLPVLLSHLNAEHIPRRLRTQMDRTAIMTRHKDALLASVLNPPPSPSGYGLQSSLLPFLARLYPDEPEVEALIRPRMPYLQRSGRTKDRDADNLMEDSQDDDDVMGIEADREHESEMLDDVPATVDRASSQPLVLDAAATRSLTPSKRRLSEDDDSDGLKRPKQETASSQIQSEWQSALSAEPVRETISTASRTTTTSDSYVGGLLPTGSAAAPPSDDDGSDFEMPPLTMDQDTDEDE